MSEQYYWGRGVNKSHLWLDQPFNDVHIGSLCGFAGAEQMLIDQRPTDKFCQFCVKAAPEVTVVVDPSIFYASIGYDGKQANYAWGRNNGGKRHLWADYPWLVDRHRYTSLCNMADASQANVDWLSRGNHCKACERRAIEVPVVPEPIEYITSRAAR